ncbi:MAG: DNA mismatch repair endonuclease MutL, partial [Pseudomonadota bacterium]|nr:DNA mismatch repair endonuclease MutL [Pseudomonadota bacterium]
MTIRLLPSTTVNRIAAGEVVERPASVIKELVENAIDAKSRSINIIIREGGRNYMSVADDGCGMEPHELPLAVERHATSKLANDNLFDITTLGFRGEALPSIGSVSRMEVTSRTRGAESAFIITVEGGAKSDPAPAARGPGTTIEVRDLFFSTPARLKFLKAESTERGHTLDVIKRLAMAHPEIAFSLDDGDRNLFNLAAAKGDLLDARLERVSAIMGNKFGENALPIQAEREGIRLSGHIGLPTLNRGNTALQFLIVNCRPVRDKLLVGAVRGAYRDFLAQGRHPLLALFLDIPADQLDINVHPAKNEVRFREPGLVRGLIVSALKHALADAGHRASTTVGYEALGAFRQQAIGHAPRNSNYRRPPGFSEEARPYHAPLSGLDKAPTARVDPESPPLAKEG